MCGAPMKGIWTRGSREGTLDRGIWVRNLERVATEGNLNEDSGKGIWERTLGEESVEGLLERSLGEES